MSNSLVKNDGNEETPAGLGTRSNTIVTRKRCRICELEKPATPEFFGPNKRSRDRLNYYCRECIRQRDRARYRANPERRRAAMRVSYWANVEKRREYCRQYNAANRDRQREYDKKRRQEHPELFRQRDQQRYWSNPEKERARTRDWQKRNPERHADIEARRRARMREAIVEKIDRVSLYERDGGRCHVCRKRVGRAVFELDYLIPLALGGSHTADNLRVAHRSCNARRNRGQIPAQLLLIG
jgi:hypothetical protein